MSDPILITEGNADVDLLRMVLDNGLSSNTTYIAAGGWSGVDSLPIRKHPEIQKLSQFLFSKRRRVAV